ncbi:hypothetical protein EON83_29955 [bacterium]|nr:MAG: hypothetical protein EON83_29955 [bacterium]
MQLRYLASSVATAAVVFLSACAFGPGHPRTWVYGVVHGSAALPINGATISLYSGKTVASKTGCFKLQLSSALPLSLSASAPGYKPIEVPAKFGFYRVEVTLENSESIKPSSVSWHESSESEVANAACS